MATRASEHPPLAVSGGLATPWQRAAPWRTLLGGAAGPLRHCLLFSMQVYHAAFGFSWRR